MPITPALKRKLYHKVKVGFVVAAVGDTQSVYLLGSAPGFKMK